MAGRKKQGGHFNGIREALYEYAYLVTLGAVIAVVAASAMYTSRVKQAHSPEVQAAAGAIEIEETATPALVSVPKTTPLPTIAPLQVRPVSLLAGGDTVWPVSGEIVRGHAPEEAVFWETLLCWQPHRGADVAGRAGEDVLCVMDGVVERISRDALWGYRVRVEQTDGTAATYAGLAVCALTEGQTVTRGQAMGELMAAIPCEAELGAHLHLEWEQDGAQRDPQTLLQNAQRR